MKTLQDLTIKASEKDLNDFKDNLIKNLSGYWSEEKQRGNRGDQYIALRYNNEEKDFSALLFLWLEKNMYKVTNIIPENKHELTYNEYNFVLNEFIKNYVKPVSEIFSLKIEISKPEMSIEDYMPNTAHLLKKFSDFANKITGSAHPSDMERWHEFIITNFKEGEVVSVDILRRWLIEEENWAENIASELVVEYENAIALLKHYEKFTQGV